MRGALLFGILSASLGGALDAQQPTLVVSGTVRDPAGAPLASASVQIGERSATTNPQGSFRLDSLEPGSHLLTVRLVGYQALRRSIVLTRGDSPRFEFVLQPLRATLADIVVEASRLGIFGTVADSALAALSGASVELVGPGGGVVRTDSGGRFAFPKAHNGQFVLRVRLDGFAERRVWLALKRNEGRELAIRLARDSSFASRADDVAFADLRERLAYNPPRERVTGAELERYGSAGLCDVNRIVQEITPSRAERGFRMRDARVLLVLNGSTVYEAFPVYSICAWRADEVELVEFGSNLCRDATRTIADLVRVWCSGAALSRPRTGRPSIIGAPGLRTQGNAEVPYVVIWEKR